MGIGKSRGTSPINVNNMLEKVEINQQIETEKSEVDKLLVEIREAKETLIKFNEDLEKAIAAESHIEGELKAAVGSCDNIVNCICNAIVKAERDTNFKATITPEQLAQLRQLIDRSIESWNSVLQITVPNKRGLSPSINPICAKFSDRMKAFGTRTSG